MHFYMCVKACDVQFSTCTEHYTHACALSSSEKTPRTIVIWRGNYTRDRELYCHFGQIFFCYKKLSTLDQFQIQLKFMFEHPKGAIQQGRNEKSYCCRKDFYSEPSINPVTVFLPPYQFSAREGNQDQGRPTHNVFIFFFPSKRDFPRGLSRHHGFQIPSIWQGFIYKKV